MIAPRVAEGNDGPFERFAIVPGAAARNENLNATDLRVLIALATFANGNRKAWPGVKNLCEATGIEYTKTGRRRVQRSLRHLEAEGMVVALDIRGGRGHAGVYLINRPSVKGDISDHPLRPKGDIQGHERVTSEALKGDISDHPNRGTERNRGAPLAASAEAAARVARAEPEGSTRGNGEWTDSMAKLQVELGQVLSRPEKPELN